MIYAISDIHGRYDKYSAMLEKINFRDEDTLYVLGDVIDRYDDGIKILIDMINRPNVKMILGNHEALMLDTINAFEVVNNASVEKMMLWMQNGGEPTLTEYVDDKTAPYRRSIMKALENMPLYAELEVGDNDFVLLHGGLDNFTPDRPLDSYSRDEIVWARPEPDLGDYFDDRITIVGHTPSEVFCGEHKIFRQGNFIDIDCGIAFESDKLGCLRLDDLCEFYV